MDDNPISIIINPLLVIIMDYLSIKISLMEPPLEQDEMDGRGFDHDLTGHFLCPIDYNWNDPL